MSQKSVWMRFGFILGLAGSISVSAFHWTTSVQAEPPSFVSAQDTDHLPAMFSGLELVPEQTFSEPQKPRVERGIICEPGQPESQECDDRIAMIDRSHPWSAIGRIVFEDDNGIIVGQCTGTLIAEDIVLTNAHCVIDPETHQPYPGRLVFEPNLINGVLQDPDDRVEIIGGVYGTDFRDKPEAPHPNDWAIVKLARPLDEKYGTIDVQAISLEIFLNNPNALTLVGYSFDFPNPNLFRNLLAGIGKTAGVHENCSVVGMTEDSVLVHECDTRGGASGGPILAWIDGEPVIVAVNSAEFANQQTGFGSENYATDVARIDVAHIIDWIEQNQ